MKAQDAESTVRKALMHAGIPKGKRPKLLSDNGSSYIADEFKTFLKDEGIQPIHGRVCHPQTQGKIERFNRSLKNRIKLDNYYSPEELERAIEKFIYYYNYQRYHESINNLTPAQVYYHKGERVLDKRRKTKIRTMNRRRKLNQRVAVKRE